MDRIIPMSEDTEVAQDQEVSTVISPYQIVAIQAKRITELQEQVASVIALVKRMRIRMRHLEQIVFVEGKPEGHDLVEDVQ